MRSLILRALTCAAGGLSVACGGDDNDAGASGGTGGIADAGPSAGGGGSGGAGAAPSDGGGAGGAPTLSDATTPDATASPPPDYADDAAWLCRPGSANDLCAESLDATIVHPDGTLELEPHVPAANPEVDCFYVYPTVSGDQLPNSDLVPAAGEEINVVKVQAARLNRVCAVYAPLYRQVTLPSLFNSIMSTVTAEERREIAYGDALAAWEYYLANHNNGRGFVLIGHSQGSGVLRRLMQERIDADATLRGQLVASYLLGSAVAVPDGADVGGDFMNVPACRDASQTGCVVSYATFRATEPPPANSLFGAPRTGPGVALCTNPAALAGGAAILTPYFGSMASNIIDLSGLDPITTPYVTLPDFLSAECVVRNGFSILELTILADPMDPRPDTIGGNITPEWGLHLIDAHIAMGDIVRLTESQTAAYLAP